MLGTAQDCAILRAREDKMAINTGRVVGGGLLAGVVMNAVDFVTNGLLLAERWKAEAEALNPRLVDPANEPASIMGWIATDFLLGILIVWAYASMRPRFGPGSRTAIKASIFVWAVSHVAYGSFIFLGLYSANIVLMATLGALIASIAGGLAGAWFYKEL
jgi:hypothetical protein